MYYMFMHLCSISAMTLPANSPWHSFPRIPLYELRSAHRLNPTDFRGREMAHQDLGRRVLERVQAELGDAVKLEAHPKMEGRQMVMIVAPKPS